MENEEISALLLKEVKQKQISHSSYLLSHLFVVPLHPQSGGLPTKHDGALAQLVEHRTENPCVPGSIPGGTTFSSFHYEPLS